MTSPFVRIAALVILAVVIVSAVYFFGSAQQLQSDDKENIREYLLKEENLRDILLPVVRIESSSGGSGTGFFVNENHIVTAGHVLDSIADDGDGTVTVRFNLYHLGGENECVASFDYASIESYIPRTSSLAVFGLEFPDSSECEMHVPKYYKLGNIDSVTPGEKVFRVSVSYGRLKSHGTPFAWSYVEAVNDFIFTGRDARNFIAVPYGVAGDSGGPVLYFDEEKRELLLLGVTETTRYITRVDVLEEFLKENDIPYSK